MSRVDCSKLSQTVSDIAMNIGADPATKNIDDVVATMRKEFPELTRSQVVDSIVEASRARGRQQSETAKNLSALRQEARKTSEPEQRRKIIKQINDLALKVGGEPVVKPDAAPQPMTKELERLAYQRDRLRQQINQGINDLKPKTVFQTVRQPFDASRAMITSFDLSMPLRQGAPLVYGHPLRAAPAFIDMFKSLASEHSTYRIAKEIENHPDAPLATRAGLKLTSEGQVEEAYQSGWVQKIPGVRASGRAATTFMNKLRIDAFSSMTKTLARNGEATLDESRAIANYINVATGKGKLGSLEKAADGLNAIFFAPKYTASRFQFLAGEPLYGGSARTRALVGKEYARYAIGMGVVFALGAAAGGKIETDPRSSDFLKLKFGNTRVDPMAGLSQVAVLVSRLASGETKSSTTGKTTPIRGKVPYGKSDAFDVLSKFIRTKLSPLAAVPTDVVAGSDAVGNKVTVGSEAQRLTVPLAMQDVYQAIQDQGVPKGAALGLLGIFGMGLQTYQNKKPDLH